MLYRHLFAAAAGLVGISAAQVTTDCNPMERDDCKPDPALGTAETWDFSTTPNGQLWETTAGMVQYEKDTGARFSVAKQGDSPTIRTKFYFFFGRIEFFLKAAPGIGIISSMMLLSDNLDEIDWEFLGANHTHASTNIFGKGIEDFTNGGYHTMPDGKAPQEEYHNYTTIWTKEKMDFYINGLLARTITAEESTTEVNGTTVDIYPQTPMRMSLGIWAGGDPRLPEGTRKWAGGDTNYEAGPYDMFVKSARVEDYSTGKEYVWGDRSGDWESIEIVGGNSTALKVLTQAPEKSLQEKWNDLPQAAKIAVYAGGAGAGAVMIAGLIFYCIKQRRRGAQEARLAEERNNADRVELAGMKASPDAFSEHGHEYTGTGKSYTALSGDDEKAWEANTAYAGAAGVRPALHSPTQSYHDRSPQSPHQTTFGTPPSPMARAHSPMIQSPNRMASPGPAQAYGAHRMQQASPDQFAMNRMQSPGPSPLSPTARSFSGISNGSPRGYRQ